jgi:hypothetical protein
MITTYRTDPKLYSPWTKTHHPRKLGLPQEKTTGSLCSLLQSTITKHNQWKTSKAPRPTLQPGISLTTPGASRVSPRASRFSPEPSRIFLFSSFSFFFDLLKRSRDGHSELWGVVTFHPSSGPSCSSCLVLDPPKVLPVSCFLFPVLRTKDGIADTDDLPVCNTQNTNSWFHPSEAQRNPSLFKSQCLQPSVGTRSLLLVVISNKAWL